MFKQSIGFLISSFICITQTLAQENNSYQKPPQSFINLLEAPISQEVKLSSDGQWMLLLNPSGLPSINELSSFEYGLAGLRIDPLTNGPSRALFFTGIKLKSTGNAVEYLFSGLPDRLQLSDLTWSPDESKVAFTHTSETGIELWVADLKTQEAKRLGITYLTHRRYSLAQNE